MKKIVLSAVLSMCASSVFASDTLTVELTFATDKGPGESVGTVTISSSEYGAVFTPNLKNIDPGVHGFHVHAKGSCDTSVGADGKVVPAGAAGGHWDPDNTQAHKGPWDNTGHKGDLPALYADAERNMTTPVLAPRIKDLKELQGLSLMVHVGGDNHSDHPKALGGGGARLACGVIK